MNKSKLDIIFGWEVPTGNFPCWVIDEEERLEYLHQGTPIRNYSPPCYFRKTRDLTSNCLEGYLANAAFGRQYHTDITSSYTYFRDYLGRKSVYLSFDRVTLYLLVAIEPTSPLTFRLKRIDENASTIKNTAFMLMPFGDLELDRFYKNNICDHLKAALNIRVTRADNFQDNDVIVETIKKQISNSEIIIAETTNNNKNVFYELGYAEREGKEIIAIQNLLKDSKLFFDRAHVRTLFYTPDAVAKFKEELTATVTTIQKRVRS